MTIMRKHFRLTEEFTYGTLLIQSAYLPVGQTPADGDWETDHTYDWDSPQETLRSLLSAMSDFAGALAGAQTANIEYASKIVTLGKQLEALEQQPTTPANESGAMQNLRNELTTLKVRYNTLGTQYGQLREKHDALDKDWNKIRQERDRLRADLTHRNDEIKRADAAMLTLSSQLTELRSQLVTAQKVADSNPLYMSAMERDDLLVQLDEMLTAAGEDSNPNRLNAVTLIRRYAVPMRLMSVQPTLAECGNLMRAMLYMYYGGSNETAFTEEDKTRACKLHAFIDAAKA